MDKFKRLQQAAQGDPQAMKAVARMALPGYRAKYQQLDQQLEHHRREAWDVDEMREWALDPETEVSREEFEAALGELMNQVLTITASTGPLLAGDDRESKTYEQVLRQGAFDLFLLVNNPVIRYTIVAGFDPRFREDVDDFLDWLGRETWGTVGALVQDDLSVEHYPPDTARLLQDVADRVVSGEIGDVDVDGDAHTADD
jgi:hypothetical protein